MALPTVFDTHRRPWVDLSAADADAVAEAIERCPTGALRYERLDGAEAEAPRRPTAIFPITDGPLLMLGDLEVTTPAGEPVIHEYRLTLCRCGMSRNQPFCDNSHRRRNWSSGPSHDPATRLGPAETASDRRTNVVLREDASLKLDGVLRLYHSDGRVMADTASALLCRCGASANKPFCDGSHQRVGFMSRAPEASQDRLEAETPAAFTPNPQVPDPRGVGGR
jgi:CDGSH-type Zn-finger protein